MNYFYLFIIRITLLFISFFYSSLIFGQTDIILNINNPQSIAGEYDVRVGTFGASICDAFNILNKDIELAHDILIPQSDACSSVVNNLSNKIALIDRGNCDFSEKSFHAQQAGAIAAIICNNQSNQGLLTMSPGMMANSVTIPSVFMSREDCDLIKIELNNGLNGDLIFMPPSSSPNGVIVWGNNGEGEFNGGLGQWTTNDISCGNSTATSNLWDWDAEGKIEGGCGDSRISAPTACNGAMGFSSDFLDNGGAFCGQGSGSCSAMQIGELISPIINLSNVASNSDIFINWWQNVRQFDSSFFVSYTLDGGITWNDIPINTNLVTNDPVTNEEKNILLPNVIGNQIQVKFRYEANYYFWIIDDIRLIEVPFCGSYNGQLINLGN